MYFSEGAVGNCKGGGASQSSTGNLDSHFQSDGKVRDSVNTCRLSHGKIFSSSNDSKDVSVDISKVVLSSDVGDEALNCINDEMVSVRLIAPLTQLLMGKEF